MADLVSEARGEGPPLVLIHAGIATRHQWDRELEAFARDHRVIRYDVRGFGDSPDITDDYYDHHDLRNVLDEHDVDEAPLVGNSNGSRIALDLAAEAPDRVRALVLVGPSLPGHPVSDELQRAWEREEVALAEGDVQTAVEVNLELWVDGVGRGRGEVDPDVRARVAGWLRVGLPREILARGDSLEVEPPLRDRLGEIDVPTLVMVGVHDRPRVHEVTDRLVAGLPRAERIVVEDAAHLINLEAPDRFEAIVRDFLSRVER